MIAFVYGTTAELIKIAPVYQRIVALGSRPLLWSTGQQADELPLTTRRLDLPEPDFELAAGAGGHSLRRTTDVPRWLATVARRVARNRESLEAALWADDRPPIVMVHGDTMTTVVGALIGRWLGVTVGHIEAGLRTNRLLEPFPEELDRRIAARLAHVHYTPGIDKFLNLLGVGGIKVDTVANTVLDAVRSVPDDDLNEVNGVRVPDRFGLVSLHRFELVRTQPRFEAILASLRSHAETTPMLVVTDALASGQIKAFGLGGYFDDRHLIRLGKLPYWDFISLLRRAAFVVTDSGGLQEECAYLDIPCLVHRTTTERTEGLGANVVLSMFDVEVVDRFLADPSRYRSASSATLPSPSDLIVEHLVRAGHCPGPTREDRRAELSVIVPAFGQASSIRSTLQAAVRALDAFGVDYEIVVLTGDRDMTFVEASQVLPDRISVLSYANNAGRARGFKYAFARTTGNVVVYADPAILITPDNIIRSVQRLRDSNADVVTGSKVHPESTIDASPVRRAQSAMFSRLVTRLVGVPAGDVQLGLKIFRREVLDDVLPSVRSTGFGFDIELLAAAVRSGYTIEQSPVMIPGRMKAVLHPAWLARAALGSLQLLAVRRRVGTSPARSDRALRGSAPADGAHVPSRRPRPGPQTRPRPGRRSNPER